MASSDGSAPLASSHGHRSEDRPVWDLGGSCLSPDMQKRTTQLLQQAIPDLTSQLRLAGLRAEVSVWRDRWGVPHIDAENEWDLFFAQGFSTAQVRLVAAAPLHHVQWPVLGVH